MKRLLPFIIFGIVFTIISLFGIELFYSLLFAVGLGILFHRLSDFDNQKDPKIREITRQKSNELNKLFSEDIQKIKNLGYTFLDEFSFENEKMFPTSICFIDDSRKIIVSFSQYNVLNNPTVITITTFFEESYSLSTFNSKMAGSIPFIEKYMIQIFDGMNILDLIENHKKSLKFLSNYNFQQLKVFEHNIRYLVLEEYKIIFDSLGNNILLKSMFYSLNGKHFDYAKLIEEQDLEFES